MINAIESGSAAFCRGAITTEAQRVLGELARAKNYTLTARAISRRVVGNGQRLKQPMLELLNDMVKAGILVDNFHDPKRVRGSIAYTIAPSYLPTEAEAWTGMDRKSVRRAIDQATTKSDAHPSFVAMVAADAREAKRPTMIGEIAYVLGQIPKVVITCAGCNPVTYRVIGERTVNPGSPDTRQQVALVCVTRTSLLHEHHGTCECRVCRNVRDLDTVAGERPRSVWYHDFTRTYHTRRPDGTFAQLADHLTGASR